MQKLVHQKGLFLSHLSHRLRIIIIYGRLRTLFPFLCVDELLCHLFSLRVNLGLNLCIGEGSRWRCRIRMVLISVILPSKAHFMLHLLSGFPKHFLLHLGVIFPLLPFFLSLPLLLLFALVLATLSTLHAALQTFVRLYANLVSPLRALKNLFSIIRMTDKFEAGLVCKLLTTMPKEIAFGTPTTTKRLKRIRKVFIWGSHRFRGGHSWQTHLSREIVTALMQFTHTLQGLVEDVTVLAAEFEGLLPLDDTCMFLTQTDTPKRFCHLFGLRF